MKLDKIGILSVPVGMHINTAIYIQKKLIAPAYTDTQKDIAEHLYSLDDLQEHLQEVEKSQDRLPAECIVRWAYYAGLEVLFCRFKPVQKPGFRCC
jgi:hypothetical protein